MLEQNVVRKICNNMLYKKVVVTGCNEMLDQEEDRDDRVTVNKAL